MIQRRVGALWRSRDFRVSTFLAHPIAAMGRILFPYLHERAHA